MKTVRRSPRLELKPKPDVSRPKATSRIASISTVLLSLVVFTPSTLYNVPTAHELMHPREQRLINKTAPNLTVRCDTSTRLRGGLPKLLSTASIFSPLTPNITIQLFLLKSFFIFIIISLYYFPICWALLPLLCDENKHERLFIS